MTEQFWKVFVIAGMAVFLLVVGLGIGTALQQPPAWTQGMTPRQVRDQILRNNGKVPVEAFPIVEKPPAAEFIRPHEDCEWMYEKAKAAVKYADVAGSFSWASDAGGAAVAPIAWANVYLACRKSQEGR